MSRRCVVTGGAGVIGQRLVEMLRERGDEVRVVDLLAPPPGLDVDVDYVQGDLVELGGRVISDFDPELLFHLAAAFERSDEQPEFWRENAHHNVEASRHVLEGAASSPRLQRYVFASSYLIYDPDLYLSSEPPTGPVELREDSDQSPQRMRRGQAAPREGDRAGRRGPAVGFDTVSARIYRVYGRSSRDVISRWVRDAVRGIGLNVYGVESFFDYVLADDVAEGLLRLGDARVTGVVNLASGRSSRVQDVIECLHRHFPELEIDGPHATETLRVQSGITPSTGGRHGVEAGDIARAGRE